MTARYYTLNYTVISKIVNICNNISQSATYFGQYNKEIFFPLLAHITEIHIIRNIYSLLLWLRLLELNNPFFFLCCLQDIKSVTHDYIREESIHENNYIFFTCVDSTIDNQHISRFCYNSITE